MISFTISLFALILGYIFYGKVMSKVFHADSNCITPAYYMQDGTDYVPMKPWRIFMIQFLNIAGLGPIFGAIMGAQFGPASFLWIVLGSIFAGGVHDYLSGMISLRHGGASLPEIHGKYLGNNIKQFMRVFMIILLILVGVVFVVGPAGLLQDLTHNYFNPMFWIILILVYYLIATLLPIDKIIGKIYPLFGACLLFMAFGILISLYVYHPTIPEFWDGLQSRHPKGVSIFPMMFISIACGAISGFHATQSPLMARCIPNEKYGLPIFYGAMIAEGVVALVWAAAASYFFFETDMGATALKNGTNAAVIVNYITNTWMGKVGAVLAIIGVIAAPITTGDTALRSARLIVADFLHYDQKPIYKRLVIAIPIFLVTFAILFYNIKHPDQFDIIWRYFSWTNQVLAVITLWAVTVYLAIHHKPYILTLIPALFMTMVCSCFILSSKIGLNLSPILSYTGATLITVGCLIWFFSWHAKIHHRILKRKEK